LPCARSNCRAILPIHVLRPVGPEHETERAPAHENGLTGGGPGIEVYLRGLARQAHQTIDGYVVDDVRNLLFGPPGAGGFDLASLNMQRGRDHGLPRYNVVRQDFGLAPKTSFAEVSSDPVMQAKLASCYATVDDIDLRIGALAEDHYKGGRVGKLVSTILGDQFTRLRDATGSGIRVICRSRLSGSWKASR